MSPIYCWQKPRPILACMDSFITWIMSWPKRVENDLNLIYGFKKDIYKGGNLSKD
jgi:hypothetical protein